MQTGVKCQMLLCKGEENSEEETAQERMTSAYSRQMEARNQLMRESQHVRSSHSKEVFSFKLNTFRNYDQSDKNRPAPDQGARNVVENVVKMSHYKSSEKKFTRPNCVVYADQANIARFYCSPPSRLETQPPRRLEKMSVMFKSPAKQTIQPKIAFKIASNQAYNSQANDVKTEETQSSSKKSEAFQRCDQRKQALMRKYTGETENGVLLINTGGMDEIETLNKNGRGSEIQTNLGNETERTLIDCLKEETYQDKECVQRESCIPKEKSVCFEEKSINLVEQRMKNHHQFVRIGSPVRNVGSQINHKPSNYMQNPHSYRQMHSSYIQSPEPYPSLLRTAIKLA